MSSSDNKSVNKKVDEKKVVSSEDTTSKDEKKTEEDVDEDAGFVPGSDHSEPTKPSILVENIRNTEGIPQFDQMTKDAKLTKDLNLEIDQVFNSETTTPDGIEAECKKLKSMGVDDKSIAYIKTYYSLVDGSYTIENDLQCMDILIHLQLNGAPRELIDGCVIILSKNKGEEAEFNPLVDLTQQAIKYAADDGNIILSSYTFKCATYLSDQLGI